MGNGETIVEGRWGGKWGYKRRKRGLAGFPGVIRKEIAKN